MRSSATHSLKVSTSASYATNRSAHPLSRKLWTLSWCAAPPNRLFGSRTCVSPFLLDLLPSSTKNSSATLGQILTWRTHSAWSIRSREALNLNKDSISGPSTTWKRRLNQFSSRAIPAKMCRRNSASRWTKNTTNNDQDKRYETKKQCKRDLSVPSSRLQLGRCKLLPLASKSVLFLIKHQTIYSTLGSKAVQENCLKEREWSYAYSS